jgi:periplasmic copper chaperone A
MLIRIALACTGIALIAAPAAAAHVTVNPEAAAAGSFARFDIRVPTERDGATTDVTVQLPDGLFFVSFQPKPGWKRSVKMEQLAQPVEIFGDEITERVASVTWSGGQIAPGEFDEFGMSVRMPETAGTELVFPALQTYAGGEVVRWIGPTDADEPAPRVEVTPAEGEEAAATTRSIGEEPAETEANEATADSEAGEGRANLALGFALAGLAMGAAALGLVLFGRPRRS